MLVFGWMVELPVMAEGCPMPTMTWGAGMGVPAVWACGRCWSVGCLLEAGLRLARLVVLASELGLHEFSCLLGLELLCWSGRSE